MKTERRNLIGLSPELDEVIVDFAFLAHHYQGLHPGNAGDVSQVLAAETSGLLTSEFKGSLSEWYEIERIERLGEIRGDGRRGYRAEGVKDEQFYELTRAMAGRVFLITRTGAQIPSIEHTVRLGQDGKLLNVMEVDETGRRVRVVYGNVQYGSIPSIETHVHVLANSISLVEGEENPAVVHCHPYQLTLLARLKEVQGDFGRLNALVYTQAEGLLRNYPGLIGVVPYFPSGSELLVVNSITPLTNYRFVLWVNHGLVVRAANIRRAYDLIAYGEESAKAALDSLRLGARGLPIDAVRDFLEAKGLLAAYEELPSR